MNRRIFGMSIFGAFLSACRSTLKTERELQRERVLELMKGDRKLEPTGEYLPPGSGHNGSFTLVSGVWVEDGLYYEALGIPVGTPPAGDDVSDHFKGIPDRVLGSCERCKRSWKWVESHNTSYTEWRGFSPLCKRCWNELLPESRIPYYRSAFERNRKFYTSTEDLKKYDADWPLIEAAVLNGQ